MKIPGSKHDSVLHSLSNDSASVPDRDSRYFSRREKATVSLSSERKVSSSKPDKYIEIDPALFRKMSEMRTQHLSLVVTKGESDVHRINLKDIDKLLSTLRKNSSKPIEGLSGTLKQTYQRFQALVSLLSYPYSSIYLKLYHRVEKHFGDLRSVKPYTIGAYCIGARIRTNLPPLLASHSPISAYAAPLPDLIREMESEKLRSEQYSLTAPMVTYSDKLPGDFEERLGGVFHLFQTVQGGDYSLKRLDRRPWVSDRRFLDRPKDTDKSRDIGVLFLPVRSSHLFQGLSQEERIQIRKAGIRYCLLYGSTEDGSHYKLFEKGERDEVLVPLALVKKRVSSPRWKSDQNPLHQPSGSEKKFEIDSSYFVIGVIFLLLALGVGYYLYLQRTRER